MNSSMFYLSQAESLESSTQFPQTRIQRSKSAYKQKAILLLTSNSKNSIFSKTKRQTQVKSNFSFQLSNAIVQKDFQIKNTIKSTFNIRSLGDFESILSEVQAIMMVILIDYDDELANIVSKTIFTNSQNHIISYMPQSVYQKKSKERIQNKPLEYTIPYSRVYDDSINWQRSKSVQIPKHETFSFSPKISRGPKDVPKVRQYHVETLSFQPNLNKYSNFLAIKQRLTHDGSFKTYDQILQERRDKDKVQKTQNLRICSQKLSAELYQQENKQCTFKPVVTAMANELNIEVKDVFKRQELLLLKAMDQRRLKLAQAKSKEQVLEKQNGDSSVFERLNADAHLRQLQLQIRQKLYQKQILEQEQLNMKKEQQHVEKNGMFMCLNKFDYKDMKQNINIQKKQIIINSIATEKISVLQQDPFLQEILNE
ncbi:hypothetical protein SS50377_21016 [Spironucleus salmonicida]|uniref:Uncharacterized protein n=1 Tax=Spironucleus salmonicida TaxID=348837 RepID=V6LJ27_9EUKA|nr:hypothetical protein SS50377_21016 [Spironucleus salmonicida]|eukprot:EST43681.1 Hypothetical protein SS50377_16727 [Spironucleus salmonicida]